MHIFLKNMHLNILKTQKNIGMKKVICLLK